MKNVNPLLGLGIVMVLGSSAAFVLAQRPVEAEGSPQGPPNSALEAWESGDGALADQNGPPTWVVEAWQNGEHPGANPGGEFGPRPWVVERHRRAAELGLPGPPAEVIEAWQNGEESDLPGPPDFVLDILGM